MTAVLTGRRGLDLTVHDEFCGLGGSSDGVHQAGGVVTLAINHNPLAIESHQANFPDTEHDCRDVRKIEPGFYAAADILVASPECKSHTYAGGRRRIDQEPLFETAAERKARLTAIRSRATMDQVTRWIRQHRYQAAIIENVGEVVDWSGFDAWLREVDRLGYDVQYCWFNSMMFGGGDQDLAHPPQSRDRLYMVLTRKGNPKPDLEHRPRSWCPGCDRDVDAVQKFTPGRRRPMRYRRQYIYACPTCGQEAFPYVAPAATAIDWTLATPPIGARTQPLKPATMARIAAGLERYGYWPTGTHHMLVEPPDGLVVSNHNPGWTRPAASHPIGAHTSLDHHALLLPTNGNLRRGRDPQLEPLPTQTSDKEHALVVPYDGCARPPGWPLPAQTSVQGDGLLVQVGGNTYERPGSACRSRPVGWPMRAQTATASEGLVTIPPSFLEPFRGATPWAKLVEDGVPFPRAMQDLIEQCGWRMLTWWEIRAGMAFRPDYKILARSNRDKVALLGQAVTPPVMSWIFARVAASLAPRGSR